MNFSNETKWLTKPNSELVFHYTSLTIALEKIFPSGQIQFGEMSNSNDLYEKSLREISPSVWGGAEKESLDSMKKAISIREILHKRSRTFCTVKDSRDSQHLGRGYMNYPLWWHYAGKNKGICFAFDKTKLHEAVKYTANASNALFIDPDDVSYNLATCDLRPVFCLTIPLTDDNHLMSEHILKHIKRFEKIIFFTKDATWNTENEFRFAVICNDDMPFKIDFSDFIVGIILGYEFPECYLPLITQYLTEYKIKAAYIDIFSGKPELYALKQI